MLTPQKCRFFLWKMCHLFPIFSLRSIQPLWPIPTTSGHVSALGGWWWWWGGPGTGSDELRSWSLEEWKSSYICDVQIWSKYILYMIYHIDFPMIFHRFTTHLFKLFLYWARSCILSNVDLFICLVTLVVLTGAREVHQPKVRFFSRRGAGLKGWTPRFSPVFFKCLYCCNFEMNPSSPTMKTSHFLGMKWWNKSHSLQVRHIKKITLWGQVRMI